MKEYDTDNSTHTKLILLGHPSLLYPPYMWSLVVIALALRIEATFDFTVRVLIEVALISLATTAARNVIVETTLCVCESSLG